MSSHFRHVTRFFSPCKRIDLCHKMSVILVFITRPNSTKNIACSNIYECPKQTICTQILSYQTVVSPFTLTCRSPRQSPGLPAGKIVCPVKVTQACLVCLQVNKLIFYNPLFPVGKYRPNYVRLKVFSKGGSSHGTENEATYL